MNKFDVDSVLKDLESSEVKTQVLAVEQAGEIVNYLVTKTVDAFRRSSHRFLVAEHIYRLGTVVVPHLEKLLKESDNSETIILASVILLRFGSRVGVSCLLDAIATDEEYLSLAASSLAAAGIKEAIDPIVDRLRNCDLKQIDLAIGLLCALEDLRTQMPSELRDRLIAEDVPWQIRSYAKRFDFDRENTFENRHIQNAIAVV